jgi:hypothetical protein
LLHGVLGLVGLVSGVLSVAALLVGAAVAPIVGGLAVLAWPARALLEHLRESDA